MCPGVTFLCPRVTFLCPGGTGTILSAAEGPNDICNSIDSRDSCRAPQTTIRGEETLPGGWEGAKGANGEIGQG